MGLHIAHWKIAGRTLAPLELNEVMYTLELGIVTAGFIFMTAAVISSAIFGRFFCSWGCHILALEDLCAWLLARVRIRPRPVRSRVLLLVPPGALLYMFVWPQVSRLLEGRPLPEAQVLTDAGGWASFVTTDFWRNLPGPGISLLTFAVCGVAIVYLLGSRSFCRYVCPYGAVFSLADRISPGRIVVNERCTQTGHCTAVCPSQIRVHEEIGRFGNVVDSSCLKCLACVGTCPNQALGFGFTRPSLGRSFSRTGRRAMRYDFTLGEDLLMAGVFIATLLILRGLYDLVPFLLALALAAIFAYAAVTRLRLVNSPHARIGGFQLKLAGRVTAAGRVFAVVFAVGVAFLAHSGFVRYHEFLGARAYNQVTSGHREATAPASGVVVAAAIGHLETVGRWGLVRSIRHDRRLAVLYLMTKRFSSAEPYLRRVVERRPLDHQARLRLARVLAGSARVDEACRHLLVITSATDANEHAKAAAHLGLAELIGPRGGFGEAVEHLRAALQIDPDSVPARYNLGVMLTALDRPGEAIEQYRLAAQLDPADVDVLNNIGFLLVGAGEADAAVQTLRRAIQLRPDAAGPHFNLGRALGQLGLEQEALASLRRAAELDPRYGTR